MLQELVISPAREWIPGCEGWIVIRVAEGPGYWLKPGTAGELNVGDGLVLGFDDQTRLRASVLCPLKLQFFTVHPQYLGLLTVEEMHQFNILLKSPPAYFLFFCTNEPRGQELTRLVEQSPGNGFPERCALLQFWANIVADLPTSHPAPQDHSSVGTGKLRERFRQMFRQMSASELSLCLPPELAQQLNCSLRHFRRLFREEFGIPFQTYQAELRLRHARQLLVESEDTVIKIAGQCGYPHMSFFNSLFKKHFGLTPGEWRCQARKSLRPGHPVEPGLARPASGRRLIL